MVDTAVACDLLYMLRTGMADVGIIVSDGSPEKSPPLHLQNIIYFVFKMDNICLKFTDPLVSPL